ncbi:MAG: CHAT domain-containing protein, partial [Proteobacteria bacterium]|nr:CHAT domain-containing protein [Pseudomonadota bacterium]
VRAKCSTPGQRLPQRTCSEVALCPSNSYALLHSTHLSEIDGFTLPLTNADSTHARRLFLTDIADRLSDVIAFAVATQASTTRPATDRDAGQIALDMLLQHKGRVLDAMTSALSRLRAGIDPRDRELLDRYLDNRSRYATLLLRGADAGRAEAHRKTLRGLQSDAEALERDIGKRNQVFQARVTPISAAAVQRTLGDDEALIEWARYRPRDHYAAEVDMRRGPERYAACIVRRTGAPVWVDLGPVEAIDAAVATWRVALMANLASVDTQARDLDARIVAPIGQRMGTIKKLYLAPDGALNLIPFAALRDEDGRYLIERHRLHYLTSGRDRVRPRLAPPDRAAPLIVASPRYDLPGNPSRHDFAPLASVLDEARAVAALYPNARLLTGEQATEGALKSMRGPALLHIATHGYFEPLHCGDGQIPADRLANTPTVQSGLVLAGANGCRSGAASDRDGTEEDGLLTALELAALDLQGTELAVLSACDTAVGTTEIRDRWGTPTGRADGVYGLRRALILAGAETQLMTLWKVEDRATRRFMAQLYRNLAEGMARSDALRAVQIAAIRKRTPPRAWAAFIMAGVDGPLQAARPTLNKPARRHGCGCSAGGAHVETSGFIGLWALFMLWLIRRTSGRGRSRPRRGCHHTHHSSS